MLVILLNWIFYVYFSTFNTQGASSGANNGEEDEEEVLHEETLRRDQVVKGAIEVLIREYASELNAPSQDGDSQPRNKKRKEKKEEVLIAIYKCILICSLFLVTAEYLVCFSSFLSPLCVRRISMPWRWRMTRET